MDLERLEVIDLLPVRSADSFVQWLGLHPGVEMITRDRSTLYEHGGRRGAPVAIQITDRYHLVSNLSEAVERDVQKLQVDARRQLVERLKARPRKARRDDQRSSGASRACEDRLRLGLKSGESVATPNHIAIF
jgi:transposase